MFSRFYGQIPSWIAVIVSFGIFFLLLPGLISMSYHPKAPGIHLIPVRIILSAVGALVFTILAIRHSFGRHRGSIFRNLCELSAVLVVLLAIFQITALIYQQSDRLQMTYGDDMYAIPRVYSPSQSNQHSGYEYITASLCLKTNAPVYAEPCNASSLVELSDRPITKRFRAYYSLDNAGATYSGDVVTDKGQSVETLPDMSFTIIGGGTEDRFLLNEEGLIERFASCFVVTKNCSVSVRSPNGILTFPAHSEDISASKFWKNEEIKWLTEFDDWRCSEPTCGGQFR